VGLYETRKPKTVGPETGFVEYSPEESLLELQELAAGAGASVLSSVAQLKERADPATLIGRGKVTEVRNLADELGEGVILFDQNLTPTQLRNLERELDRKVLDRTQLILDVFARHARTREGQLQVELAQLSYLLPRLSGHGAAMSRLGGGIGTRGPGETKLETDRRRISQRIEKLKDDLAAVRATRQLQRKKRAGVPLSTIALVGYTNAGKSTVFNRLTDAHVLADARMFATLDPTIRALDLPSRRRALLSDTVGFIRNLPPGLIESFRATLEEVTEASMILHVVDISSPHHREQMHEVERVLEELGASAKTQVLVLNKTDQLEPREVPLAVERERGGAGEVVAISALRGEGIAELIAAIDRRLPGDPVMVGRFHFSHSEGEKLSFLYEYARVLERADLESGVDVVAEAAESVVRRLKENAVGGFANAIQSGGDAASEGLGVIPRGGV
jgi:GTP-binding protein HflX